MYDGTVFFHLYPELTDPKPIFNTFLEGALHCAEVARSHPAYCSAHFHEAYDQAAAIDGAPHGYFNMSLFSCPPAELWSAFEDLHECLDIGHANQVHHPLPCRVERPSPLLRIAEPRDHTRRARVMYANDIVRFQTGFKQAVGRFRSSRARRVPEGRTLRPREGRIFSFFSYLGDEAGYFLASRAVHHLWPWPAWASPPASLASQCSWSSRMSPIAMAPTANARSLLTSYRMFFEPCENMCTVAQ